MTKYALVVDGRSRKTFDQNAKDGFRNWSGAWAELLNNFYSVEANPKHFSDVSEDFTHEYDLVIFGGSGMNVYNPNEDTHKYMNLVIQALDKRIPIIGSCFGMQTVCSIFGSKVRRMPKRELGLVEIKYGINKKYKAYTSHRDIVEPSSDFKELAHNDYGCQAVRLKNYPFLGLQHHPEWNGQDMMNIINKERLGLSLRDQSPTKERFIMIEKFLRNEADIEI